MTPTLKGIRLDEAGSGLFNARRSRVTDGKSIKYKHNGVDYCCEPGQEVYAPWTGEVIREARPYATTDYSGLLIESKDIEYIIFYINPLPGIIKRYVTKMQLIGTAQDISLKYPGQGMTPHVHLQIERINPELLLSRM